MQCVSIRQEDEYFCSKCGLRWDIDEKPPPCSHTDESSKHQNKNKKDKHISVFKRK